LPKQTTVIIFFSALMLLVVSQEGHLACKVCAIHSQSFSSEISGERTLKVNWGSSGK